ncbi:MAG: MafI family immunity protein [Desulforhopalus sp.]|jgi:hypothetical protein|nr:MafI family immunity protein [Desulforhopalus sp.]
MNEKELENKLHAVLSSVKAAHPNMNIENVAEFIKYNEWKLAVEVLCENLVEEKLYVSKETYSDLISAAESLNVEKKYWENILVK